MCDDPKFKPAFIGTGMGRAMTPDHFSRGHLLMWLYREISKDRRQMAFAAELCSNQFSFV
jgi:hypothetical protein